MQNYELSGFETRRRRRAKRPGSAPVEKRLKCYLSAIFAKGTRLYTVDFDRLAKSFDCTRRTVEMAVKKVRESGRWIFQTVRTGRFFTVTISDRNPLPSSGVFSSEEKKIQNNTARQAGQTFEKSSEAGTAPNVGGWKTKAAPASILRLAAWIARHQLGRLHRAASRTMFRQPHAANFAAEALHAGHDRADVVSAYEYALRSVDSELGHLPPAVRWEPSSVVKLARRRLSDGLTDARRVAARWRVLNRPAPMPDPEPAPVSPIVPRGTDRPVNPALERFNLGRALMLARQTFGETAEIVSEIRARLAALPQS